ncbi:MAG: hypothetical protein AABW51_01595 [Nanoarchaeota archaeon]
MVNIIYSDKFTDEEVNLLNKKFKIIFTKFKEFDSLSMEIGYKEKRKYTIGKPIGTLFIERISKKTPNFAQASANIHRLILSVKPYEEISFYNLGHELSHFLQYNNTIPFGELNSDIFVLSKGEPFLDDIPVYFFYSLILLNNKINEEKIDSTLKFEELIDFIEKYFKSKDKHTDFRLLISDGCKKLLQSKKFNDDFIFLLAETYDLILKYLKKSATTYREISKMEVHKREEISLDIINKVENLPNDIVNALN